MKNFKELAKKHLSFLCEGIDNRCVGSKGNLKATDYFMQKLKNNNWQVETQEFEAFDWVSEAASIETGELKLQAYSSPYSEPCDDEAEAVIVSSLEELETVEAKDKIMIVKGELAREQLMPKNFVFYNPDHHQRIVSLFEIKGIKALIFIVGKSGFYEGGEYPFPIIEDGDFLIPSVFISEETGEKLLTNLSDRIKVISRTKKTPSKGYNVIGRKGNSESRKISVTAHIDAKKGSSGAIDNATGVVTLLLISEMLKNYRGDYQIEMIAFNGEDYYSVPGQMTYIRNKKDDFSDIALNINIDGAGLNKGNTSYSLMDLPGKDSETTRSVFNKYPGLEEGTPWVQGDHSIFLQYGIPAIAITSKWLIDNLANQNITHTSKDNSSIVNLEKIVELSEAVSTLIRKL